jgi:hypothetical protein
MNAQDETPKTPKARSEGEKIKNPNVVWLFRVASSFLTLGVLGVAALGIHWALGVAELRS